MEKGGKQRLWGLATALITLHDFLANADLGTLAPRGFRYQLWHSDPVSGKKEVFAGLANGVLSPPVATTTINLPHMRWHLDVAFARPSLHSPSFYIEAGMALITALLMAAVVFLLLQLPERLREQVREKARELESIAFFDRLTGLPNRRLFMDRMTQAIRQQQRNKSPFALLMLDLDNFKRVNETLGHEAGDRMLHTVATRIADHLRSADTVARIDGDEFAILLGGVSFHGDISRIARKVLALVHEPVPLAGRDIIPAASMGVTLCPDDSTDAGNLIRNAELAMDQAKKTGKNNFQYFRDKLNIEAARRLDLETDMRRALEEDQFILNYQPLVNLHTGQVESVEALVRWQHPRQGLISPAEFIPAAEECGLIIEIGEAVLRTACLEIQQLSRPEIGTIKVSVNLSPRQFRHHALADTVAAALGKSGLPPERLDLEITESTLMDDVNTSLATLNRLKESGITLSIDDFGKGYSSLSMLKQLPVDKLKIDRDFVRDIPHDRDDREIVSAVIVMAHKLGLSVVAEGVETRDQVEFLVANQCDLAQGFLFSKPVPTADLPAALSSLQSELALSCPRR